MKKLDEINLKLDGRTLIKSRPRRCWLSGQPLRHGKCSRQIQPYIAIYLGVLPKNYVLACTVHQKQMYRLGWKRYEEK
jgi:hypothetical protein